MTEELTLEDLAQSPKEEEPPSKYGNLHLSALKLAEEAPIFRCTRLTAPSAVDESAVKNERRKRLASMKHQHQEHLNASLTFTNLELEPDTENNGNSNSNIGNGNASGNDSFRYLFRKNSSKRLNLGDSACSLHLEDDGEEKTKPKKSSSKKKKRHQHREAANEILKHSEKRPGDTEAHKRPGLSLKSHSAHAPRFAKSSSIRNLFHRSTGSSGFVMLDDSSFAHDGTSKDRLESEPDNTKITSTSPNQEDSGPKAPLIRSCSGDAAPPRPRRKGVSPVRRSTSERLVRQRSRRDLGATTTPVGTTKPRYSRKQRLQMEPEKNGASRTEKHEKDGRPQIPRRTRSGDVKNGRQALDGRTLTRAHTGPARPTRKSPTRKSPTRQAPTLDATAGESAKTKASLSPDRRAQLLSNTKGGSGKNRSSLNLDRHSGHKDDDPRRVTKHSHSSATSKRGLLQKSPSRRNTVTQAA